MTNLSQVVQDERTARMLLPMIVEPDDAVTGRLLGELGARTNSAAPSELFPVQ